MKPNEIITGWHPNCSYTLDSIDVYYTYTKDMNYTYPGIQYGEETIRYNFIMVWNVQFDFDACTSVETTSMYCCSELRTPKQS